MYMNFIWEKHQGAMKRDMENKKDNANASLGLLG